VSGLVQADLTKLAAIDATANEIDTLDALSRGSLIYGNASAATAILTKGSNGTVLTSDGTDISWSAAAGVADNAITLAKMATGTDGNLISYDASGNPVAVATGNDGQVLTSTGAGSPPVFESIESGIAWQTIVTGSTLTAVSGRGYWINTSSNTCTITLPSSASNGDQIIFADYARTWGTNALIIDSNGLKYQGETDAKIVQYSTSGETINIVYSGATQGWIPIDDGAVVDAPVTPVVQRGIFGFGANDNTRFGVTNLVNSSGVVGSDVAAVGTIRQQLQAAGYGGDKGIFRGGYNGSNKYSLTNLVSNQGVIASDVTGVGGVRVNGAAASYGADLAIFGFGDSNGITNDRNLVNSSGVVATDATGAGSARAGLAAAGYGGDKAIFAHGQTNTEVSMSNLVNNVGVIGNDVTGVGTARRQITGASFAGGDRGIIYAGYDGSNEISTSNLISNQGVVAADASAVGTGGKGGAGTSYGGDKAIFAFGSGPSDGIVNTRRLVNSSGVVASDANGVGTVRYYPAATGYSNVAN